MTSPVDPGDVRQVIERSEAEKYLATMWSLLPLGIQAHIMRLHPEGLDPVFAALRAAQPVDVERSWRCFHCGEVFTTEREASEHFGTELPFGQETPACIEVLTTGEKALVVEVRSAREEAQRTAAENDLLGQQIAGFEASLRQRFKGETTIHGAFNLYDSMEGRALAAEERAEKAEADVERITHERNTFEACYNFANLNLATAEADVVRLTRQVEDLAHDRVTADAEAAQLRVEVERLQAELAGVKANWELDQRVLDRLKASPPAPSGWQPGDALLNPVNQVYFRAGLLACREYMARFVEALDPTSAQAIRASWWPSLGADPGAPRKMEWSELTEGEFGTPSFRCKTAEEVSPSIEALPVALGFLELPPAGEVRASDVVRLKQQIDWLIETMSQEKSEADASPAKETR